MKTNGKLIQASLALASILFITARAEAAAPSRADRFKAGYNRLPISFEANIGQADSSVEFLAHGRNGSIWLTGGEARLIFQNGGRNGAPAALQLRFAGGDLHPGLTGLDLLPGKVNYFSGSDANRWRADAPTFAKVRYHDVYPGVDLIYYGTQQELEYDLVVQPGADASRILLEFGGAEKISLDGNGDLLVHLAGGPVRQHKPMVYQEIGGARKTVAGHYVVHSGQQVGFELGDYDRNKPLVIDPVLGYSGTFGGSGLSAAWAIAVDAQDNVYVTGNTTSSDFSTVSPWQASLHGAQDAFVIKFDTNSAVVFSTYLGSSVTNDSSTTSGQGIALDAQGNIYVAGYTTSKNFPTKNALQATNAGVGFAYYDAFVTKLNPAGDGLAYSTYLGGEGFDAANAIAVDAAGEAVVTGYTQSTDFPTVNAAQPAYGGNGDAFVAKLSADGGSLIYSTYLGGNDSENNADEGLVQILSQYNLPDDLGGALALDTNGNAYVTGWTFSTNFPLLKAFQTTGAFYPSDPGNLYMSAFMTKFNPDGDMVYSSYFAGGANSTGNGIGVDASGNIYLAGSAEYGLPTTNAFQPSVNDNGDGFVAAFDPTGEKLIYCTYLGGSGADLIEGMTVNFDGEVAVTGYTESPDFPVLNAFQAGGFQGMFSSSDGGGTWKRSNSGLKSGIVYAIQVDPSNPSVVYALVAAGYSGNIFKSTDAGASWSSADNGLGFSLTPTSSGSYGNLIALDPAAPGTLYLGGYGDVFKTTNGAAEWASMGKGLPNDTVQTMAIDPSTPTTLYGGTLFDGVYKSTDGGETWAAMNSGLNNMDVQAVVVDPNNSANVYAGVEDFFDSSFYKSTNGGASWSAVSGGLPGGSVTMIVVDAAHGSIYAVVGNIFDSPDLEVSTDGGEHWSQLIEGLGMQFTAFAVAAPSSPTLSIQSSGGMEVLSWPDSFAGYALQFTPSLNPTNWNFISPSSSTENGNVVVSVPHSGPEGFYRLLLTNGAAGGTGTLYLGTDLNSGQGVLESPDGGITWNVAGGLGGDTINALAVNPANSSVIYAGLDGGSDGFISVLTAAGQLDFSSYLGGSGADYGIAITSDQYGNLFAAGFTSSSDFPTTPNFNPTDHPLQGHPSGPKGAHTPGAGPGMDAADEEVPDGFRSGGRR